MPKKKIKSNGYWIDLHSTKLPVPNKEKRNPSIMGVIG